MSSSGSDHLVTELRLLIGRYRLEYEMTYAETVGCLELVKFEIALECQEENDE